MDSVESRRFFLRTCVIGGCLLPFSDLASGADDGLPESEYGRIFHVKDARFWEQADGQSVQCGLCPRRCTIASGARGFCGVRQNRDGRLMTLAWGNACTLGIDPVEKKPLYHFMPGERAFSIATAGCNMKCKFCQNWNISQAKPENTRNYNLPPDDVVKLSIKHGCAAVAFTYSEPTVFYEYMYDTAAAAKAKGLKPIVISNGFINEEPLKRLCEVVAAVKIDLKAFNDDFYKNITSAQFKPVQETILRLKEWGVWLEIVNLIIPTLNDQPKDIKAMCKWIKSELGADVPLHFSAFHPMFKLLNLPRTPDTTMFEAYDIAKGEGLNFVYVGNVRPAGHKAEQTICPACGKPVIERSAYLVKEVKLKNGACAHCGKNIPGVWW